MLKTSQALCDAIKESGVCRGFGAWFDKSEVCAAQNVASHHGPCSRDHGAASEPAQYSSIYVTRSLVLRAQYSAVQYSEVKQSPYSKIEKQLPGKGGGAS